MPIPVRIQERMRYLDAHPPFSFRQLFGGAPAETFKAKRFALSDVPPHVEVTHEVVFGCRALFTVSCIQGKTAPTRVYAILWELADGRFMFQCELQALILTSDELGRDGVGNHVVSCIAGPHDRSFRAFIMTLLSEAGIAHDGPTSQDETPFALEACPSA